MNTQLRALLDRLHEKGLALRLNWETPRWNEDEGRVLHYTVAGGTPGLRTYVVIEYPKGNGYGLYAETGTTGIDEDVDLICGKQ